MRLDWQAVAVALIIIAALAYTARRALGRLRSFRASGRTGAAACETGCGSCGGEPKVAARSAPALVQINRAGGTARPDSR
ncbi:MAG TPA: hypothetical protein VM934_13510 [Pyrinomonadaceae bacterium]|jgi:hypothetical protein|nr:hypothetical protein [Pyrinomonadaceae bacterium]